jgi:hypothetical protein
VSKVVMGWPLQILGLAGMAWLLSRNHTPLDDPGATGPSPETAAPGADPRSRAS